MSRERATVYALVGEIVTCATRPQVFPESGNSFGFHLLRSRVSNSTTAIEWAILLTFGQVGLNNDDRSMKVARRETADCKCCRLKEVEPPLRGFSLRGKGGRGLLGPVSRLEYDGCEPLSSLL